MKRRGVIDKDSEIRSLVIVALAVYSLLGESDQ
jgi:hypothetical protein